MRVRTDRTGQSLVEFALVAPVMLLLVFGMLQFGLVLNAQLSLTEGVRQAAEVAATGQTVSSTLDSAVATDAPMVENLLVTVSNSETTPQELTVTAFGSYPVLVPDLPFLGNSVPLSASMTMLTLAPPGG